MNAKHMIKHLERYKVEQLSVDGMTGAALVDRGGDPVVVTALLFDDDGLPVSGRIRVPAAEATEAVSKLVKRHMGSLTDSIPLSVVLDYFGLRGNPPAFAQDVLAGFLVTPEGQGADAAAVETTAASWLNANGLLELGERLDQEVLDCLSCVSEFKRSSYAFYANTGDLGIVRRQAAKAYPLLAGEISNKLTVKMAVDRKQPLQEVLMRAFGVNEVGDPRLTKPLLKRLTNRKLPDGGVPVQVIINALSELPADWFPKTDEDWSTFLDLTDTFFRRLAPEIGVTAADMANGAAGKWGEFARRIAKAYAWTQAPEELTEEEKRHWKPVIDTSRRTMSEVVENARDVVQAFRNLVILPLAANAGQGVPVFVGPEQLRHASDVAASILYGGQSLTGILELQRHWHTQAHNIEAAAGADIPTKPGKMVADDGWAPMCDVIIAPNGIEIHPLTDPREIKDEGACGLNSPGPDSQGIMGLGHCVGGYSANCRNGTSHILSFRRMLGGDQFERLSTAEFGKFAPDSTELRGVQHHGVRNGPAPAEAKAAYDWFVASVRDGHIPLNHDGVMTYLAGRRKVAEEVEAYSGYDWKDREAVEAALQPWRNYMPKRIRGLDIEAIQAQPEFADLIQAIAPSFGYAARRM